eukprot:7802864-Pyramimonas_sp.AAC.1
MRPSGRYVHRLSKGLGSLGYVVVSWASHRGGGIEAHRPVERYLSNGCTHRLLVCRLHRGCAFAVH